MPCRTMCTVCGFAALSHSYFIRLYLEKLPRQKAQVVGGKTRPASPCHDFCTALKLPFFQNFLAILLLFSAFSINIPILTPNTKAKAVCKTMFQTAVFS
ncbi:hypothetical protein D0T90_03460 [Neisseria animalis]|uniref:Uncharacterized protein n=1 Tax=Neisseria animalis TaxID=492 RepID=A0A5P3MQ38_NEIAN|nr:hypothetical protein D0T90_03460 [Neisseria animalis]ROW32819.1 hypothetical protein CGZ60_03080 [Neisseria animalis]